jgi:transcriptional regulator with XRE-family HTH domain
VADLASTSGRPSPASFEEIADPSMSQIAALAAAFGVPPTYLLDQSREPSVLDEAVLEALADVVG